MTKPKYKSKYYGTGYPEDEYGVCTDAVVFANHIGIVSDKRNSEGITYVIHHPNLYQISYEEDILKDNNYIIGHYRIN